MSVFDNKDGFKPRDLSISTKVKYESEVAHYMRTLRSSEINNRTVSLGETTGAIGAILTLLVSLIVLAITAIIDFVKWIKTR